MTGAMTAGRPSGSAGMYTALFVCAYTGCAGITTVYSLLSTLYRDFDDPVRVAWVVTSYFLVSAIASALCGRFGDVIGRRRMTLAVLPVAALGALISANAETLNGVIVGCSIQGVAGALTPLALGIVRESIPAPKMPFAVGVVMAALVGGGGISFMVAGFVIDHYSWTGGFYMKVVLAVLTFVAVIAWVPDRRRSGGLLGKVNLPVGLLFAPAVAGFFVAIQLAHTRGWNNALVLGLLVAVILILAFWSWHQSRQAVPLIDVKLLARRQVLLANLCFVFLCLGTMQNGQLLSLFLQQPEWTRTGFGLSAAVAGTVMMALLAISLVASPASGALAARYGARQVAIQGFVLGTVGYVVLAVFHPSFVLFIGAAVLGALCVSVTQTAAYALVIEAVPEEQASEAAGLTNVIVSVFMAIGAQFVTLLLATSQVDGGARGAGSFPGGDAYSLAFIHVAVMSLCGIVTALAVPRHRPGKRFALLNTVQ
jgi:MFS family permease